MFDKAKISLQELQSATFEAQPTPLIAYSRSGGVVFLANRAAHRLFADPHSPVGRSVTRLHIVSTEAGTQLKHLLLGEKNGEATARREHSECPYQGFWEEDHHRDLFDDDIALNRYEDDVSSSTRQVEVKILREPPLPVVASRMTIASLSLLDESIYMLTFERSESNHPHNRGLSHQQLSEYGDSSTLLNRSGG